MPRLLSDARSLAEHGGISRVAARVLAHLQRTRPDTEIITIATGWKPSERNIHLRLPNKLWSVLCVTGVTSLDRAATQHAKRSFDELFLPNVGFVGTPNIPYTVVVHDLSFLIEPTWFSFRMRLWHRAVRATQLIQGATHVWCVSHTTASDVVRLLNVPRERITVLPQDVVVGSSVFDFNTPTTENAALPKPYVLAFTGSPRKNAATAIAAVERLKQDARFENLRLVLVGTHAAPRTQRHPWLTTIPFLTDAELHSAYQHASALLYPSWYEGFGLPLHEATAFRIPILASAHGALPETAPTGALLIPPAKPHLWAAALREILK